jgi:hypothetical protein
MRHEYRLRLWGRGLDEPDRGGQVDAFIVGVRGERGAQ